MFLMRMTVVLFYEYIITLDKEIESVWQRKKSVVSWLFFVVSSFSLIYFCRLGSLKHRSLEPILAYSHLSFCDPGCVIS